MAIYLTFMLPDDMVNVADVVVADTAIPTPSDGLCGMTIGTAVNAIGKVADTLEAVDDVLPHWIIIPFGSFV